MHTKEAWFMNVKELQHIFQMAREADTILFSLKRDVFTQGTRYKQLDQLAAALHMSNGQTQILLEALSALQLMVKSKDGFELTAFAKKYFVKDSPDYIGDYLQFWQNKNVIKEKMEGQSDSLTACYGFEQLAQVVIPEIRYNRAPNIIKVMKTVFPDGNKELRILDLGGGSGGLLIAALQKFPRAYGVVFDSSSVIPVAQWLAARYQVDERMHFMAGDFTKDSIGDEYDFIIASGIMDFAKRNFIGFCQKLCDATRKGGYVYVVSCGFNESFTKPRDAVINWLGGRLQNEQPLCSQKEIEETMCQSGFQLTYRNKVESICQNFQGFLFKKA